jgi:hypothetical protein
MVNIKGLLLNHVLSNVTGVLCSGNVAQIPSAYHYVTSGYRYIDPVSNEVSDCITLNDSDIQDWRSDIRLGILAQKCELENYI